MRHLAGAFIWPRRATIGRARDRKNVDAAITHVDQLLAQGDGLWPCLPCMQHPLLGLRVLETADLVEHEVNAGRHDQAIVVEVLDFLELDGLLVGVDLGHLVVDHLHAIFAQTAIADGQILDLAAAAEYQIGQGAGNKRPVHVDHEHFDRAL